MYLCLILERNFQKKNYFLILRLNIRRVVNKQHSEEIKCDNIIGTQIMCQNDNGAQIVGNEVFSICDTCERNPSLRET